MMMPAANSSWAPLSASPSAHNIQDLYNQTEYTCKSNDLNNRVAVPGRSKQRYICEKDFSLQNKENYNEVMLGHTSFLKNTDNGNENIEDDDFVS
jgi:hypothetical protein